MEPVVAEFTKQCTKCKQIKSAPDFTKKTAARDGLNSWCRACLHESSAAAKPKPESPSEPKKGGRPRSLPREFKLHEPAIWIREERPKFQEPEPEPVRFEPEIEIDDQATDKEQREFVRRFVDEYIAKNGETCDEFFVHWIQYRYPEIDRDMIRLTITVMVKCGRLKVSRWETGENERISFLVLP